MDWGFAIVKIFITFLIEFLKNRKSTSLKTTLVIPIKIQNNISGVLCYVSCLILWAKSYALNEQILMFCYAVLWFVMLPYFMRWWFWMLPLNELLNGFVINLLETLKLKHSWCIHITYHIYWIKLDLQRLPINKKQEAIK